MQVGECIEWRNGGDRVRGLRSAANGGTRRSQVDVLADRIAIYAARLDAGEHQLLTTIRSFDRLRGWAVQGAPTCAAWLSHRIGVGLQAAREKVRVAVALGELPLLNEALRKGQLSYAKARAMTRVATPETEALLLAQARGTTGAQLERICAKFRRFVPGALTSEDVRYVRRRTSRDGTVKIEMSLLPDEAELVFDALRKRQARLVNKSCDGAGRGPRPTLADAAVDLVHAASRECGNAQVERKDVAGRMDRTLFVHLMERSWSSEAQPTEAQPAAAGPADRARSAGVSWAATAAEPAAPQQPDVSAETSREPERAKGRVENRLEVDRRELRRFDAELDDGTPLCGATLRRIACDAGLVMAERSTRGAVLDVGRKRRTIPSALTRALHVRDRCCRFPGCTRRAFLDAHHIEHWSKGGETRLNNLVRLCHFHHVAVHEGGFDVRPTEGGVAFYDPHGRVLEAVVPAVDLPLRTSAVEQLAIEQRTIGVEVDARSSLPKCPGLSFRDIDIAGCVRALARRAGHESQVDGASG